MDRANFNILIVDDEPLIRKSLYEILKIEGFHAHMAQSGEEAVDMLRKIPCDIVIADMKLPQMSGLELLERIKKNKSETDVILITGFGTIETAVDAMRKGAFDYITKPIIDSEIKIIIDKILEKKQILKENKNLRSIVAKTTRSSFHNIVGSSERMQKIYNIIESVANTKATILLTGESGTGKGLVAQAIHKCDEIRKDQSFVEVSCGALSETLLESEIFGHVKGAFTGAIKEKHGRFEKAHGGTIFLDEIDAFTPHLQTKLLRVLQDGAFERVGETETRFTDARIIVATNRNLSDLVAHGQFREDLFYRINVIPIQMPALRERKEDIDLLVTHFLEKYNKKNNRNVLGISEEVRKIFNAFHWPGNVRQLEHAVEVAVIMTREKTIQKGDLPENLREKQSPAASIKTAASLKEGLVQPEKDLIIATLEKCNWNRNNAAKSLSINRTTLYNKMKKYGIPFKRA